MNERRSATRSRSLRAILLVGSCAFALAGLFAPASASAAANAIITPSGYNANAIPRGDDTNNLVVNLPFNMNWLGTSYNQVYVNMNGNVTFVDPYCDSSYSQTYQAHHLNTTQYYTAPNPYLPIIAPFFADVDTGNTTGGQATYSSITPGSIPQYQGHNCFIVSWVNAMSYVNSTHSPSPNTNSFQLVLVDRSDTGAGNFDMMFNYNTINWDVGSTGGSGAVAGWSTAQGASGSYELPGSLSAAGTSALLDSSPSATSLIQNFQNPDGVLGRYIWQVRNGSAPNSAPVITLKDRVLEGNCSAGYLGYTGSGDATAVDNDGMVMNFHNNLPAVLPTGTTNVTWTATDDDSAVTTDTQSVTVTDTIAPSTPALSSPRSTGVWSNNNVVGISGTGVTDVCTGLNGLSYSWSQNSTGAPDAAIDSCATNTVTIPATTTVTVTDTTTVDAQTFATATWPAAWTRSDATYIRLTNAAGRFHGTYAVEAYTGNTTRRTNSFYRDYNLAGFTTASINFWENVSALAGGSDYERVEYSTDGGTTYTQIENLTAASAWSLHTLSLPVGGTVRVRFSASVNATTEYADWDDITVAGYKTTSTPVATTTSTTSMATTGTLGDGVWYFNVRTVDRAGNWSTARSIGPFYVDTVTPVTTSNAPSAWASATVSVTLTPTDPSGPIAYTRYQLDSSAVATYSAAISVSGDGTHTLAFWSADLAGNVESTKTATIQIDTTAPSTPTSVAASAVGTTSVEVNWAASNDAISGVAYYVVYRNGSVVGTTTATTYTDGGVSAGFTYPYYVVAVNGSGIRSANSATASATTPSSEIWMSLSTDTVDMGSLSPGLASTLASATTVKVGGVGALTYDFWCSAVDFANAATSSVTPTMPIGTLSYATNGYATVGLQPFTSAPYKLDTASGSKYVWQHDYRFDYVLNVPWAFDPGTYTTTVTYTVVSR